MSVFNKKSNLIIAATVAFLLITGIVKFTNQFNIGEKEIIKVPEYFYEIDDITVNLADDKKSRYIKLSLSLEVESAVIPQRELIEAKLPIIKDAIQMFLGELRSSDVYGSGAMINIKNELLKRINLALEPHHIKNIFFKQFLVN